MELYSQYENIASLKKMPVFLRKDQHYLTCNREISFTLILYSFSFFQITHIQKEFHKFQIKIFYPRVSIVLYL
jgi:hypothetical protein